VDYPVAFAAAVVAKPCRRPVVAAVGEACVVVMGLALHHPSFGLADWDVEAFVPTSVRLGQHPNPSYRPYHHYRHRALSS